jgi:hypothetical protein
MTSILPHFGQGVLFAFPVFLPFIELPSLGEGRPRTRTVTVRVRTCVSGGDLTLPQCLR